MLEKLLSLIRRPKPDFHTEILLLPRNPGWAKLRNSFIRGKACVCCGTKRSLNVHHIKPFHLFPELELDISNLVVLCESPSLNCHFWFGHLGDWRSYNIDVVEDSEKFHMKIVSRPSS